MEEAPKRFTMNTSLKNARIFDEDSWEAETALFIDQKETVKVKDIKKESDDSINFENVLIDKEPTENYSCSSESQVKVKEEILEESEQFMYMNVPNSLLENFTPQLFGVEIKKEVEDTHDSIECENQREFEILSTPVKNETISEIQPTFTMENSNPSPFTKEHFRNFSLDSPNREVDDNVISETRKSYKRTIFTRHSPYKKDIPDYLTNSVRERLGPPVGNSSRERRSPENSVSYRVPAKKRLGSIAEGFEFPKKKVEKLEVETDTEVLARRQKQIDYGKNTIGYDNYIRKVKRDRRSQDDPKTPNKLQKYSRRAWDGLIKQWRLKLHKYDDEDV